MQAWQIAAYSALALLTTILLAWPVWRRRQRLGRIEAELAVCRAQLEELERDRELGLVDDRAAKAAETEIKRRMLAIAGESEKEEGREVRPLRSVAIVSALLVPIASVALYLYLGRPDLPDMPLASRGDLPGREVRMAGGEEDSLPNVEEMVARLEKRLAEQPEDVDGWLMLARSNIVLGRYAEAARAYQRAEALSPQLPGVAGALGEALTLAAQGMVTPAAKEAFEREFERNPRDPRARFYIGLSYEQAGEFDKALSAYLELGRDSTSDAPWLPQLRSRIQAVAEELDVDVEPLLAEVGTLSTAEEAARLARALEENPGDWQGWIELVRLRMASGEEEAARADLARAREIFAEAPFVTEQLASLAMELGLEEPPARVGSGPGQEAVAAAARMSPEEQRAMIASMVDRLAARLERQPDDIEGWRMLARSYRVLGRREEAAEVYGTLARKLPEDVEAQLDYALALLETVPAEDPLPEQVVAAFETVRNLDTDQPDALFYLGLAAAQRGDAARARELWERLLSMLPAETPQYEEVKKQLDALDS